MFFEFLCVDVRGHHLCQLLFLQHLDLVVFDECSKAIPNAPFWPIKVTHNNARDYEVRAELVFFHPDVAVRLQVLRAVSRNAVPVKIHKFF